MFSPMPTNNLTPAPTPLFKPKRLHRRRFLDALVIFVNGTNWIHIAFKTFAYTYVALILWLAWSVCPYGSLWKLSKKTDGVPITRQDFANYFSNFVGYSECGIRASDLYTPPQVDVKGFYHRNAFCHTRASLLSAMSNGGRVGFDAPYTPQGCHYRWYSIAEVCMIFERFDTIVFIGDSTLQTVYNGLNILLRQDLSLGALKPWEMNAIEQQECKCGSQFVKETCGKYYVTNSEDVSLHATTDKPSSRYACQRTPHSFLHIEKSPAPASLVSQFRTLVPKAPPSNYKPIPIIHSLTLPNSVSLASASLAEFLDLADASKRKTPMLWMGPPAAGHVEVKGRKGNQEIWQFAGQMEDVAREKDVEVLGMWNMTVQAESWDGLRFGERVSVVQAMMVINWLGRLESS